tara:strand:+ start:3766 stop:4170 length:405 start_codon:yes stop_codon:yes gene_type:complete
LGVLTNQLSRANGKVIGLVMGELSRPDDVSAVYLIDGRIYGRRDGEGFVWQERMEQYMTVADMRNYNPDEVLDFVLSRSTGQTSFVNTVWDLAIAKKIISDNELLELSGTRYTSRKTALRKAVSNIPLEDSTSI